MLLVSGNLVKAISKFEHETIIIIIFVTLRRCPILIISGRQSWKNDACVDLRAELQEAG